MKTIILIALFLLLGIFTFSCSVEEINDETQNFNFELKNEIRDNESNFEVVKDTLLIRTGNGGNVPPED